MKLGRKIYQMVAEVNCFSLFRFVSFSQTSNLKQQQQNIRIKSKQRGNVFLVQSSELFT